MANHEEEDTSMYARFHGINHISKREYQKWVKARAEDGDAWAVALEAAVARVQQRIDHCLVRLETMGKCETLGGFSTFCRMLPTALPPASTCLATTVTTCAITGMRERPCFLLKSTKTSLAPVPVHMRLLGQTQSCWTLRHFASVLGMCMLRYVEKRADSSLAESCEAFGSSAHHRQLAQYLATALDDVERILASNHHLQLLHRPNTAQGV